MSASERGLCSLLDSKKLEDTLKPEPAVHPRFKMGVAHVSSVPIPGPAAPGSPEKEPPARFPTIKDDAIGVVRRPIKYVKRPLQRPVGLGYDSPSRSRSSPSPSPSP